MKPYFENEENWQVMRNEMESWVGTPYRHLGLRKGRGVDCTLLVGAILVHCGILEKVVYDYYAKDWHLNTDEEKVLEGILAHYRAYATDDNHIMRTGLFQHEKPMRGDILAFNYPQRNVKVSHHAAIYIGDENGRRNLMLHAIAQRGVSITQFNRHWRDRLTNIFRIYTGE